MQRYLGLALGLALFAVAPLAWSAPFSPPEAPTAADPFLWLEDVHGARATEWVKVENAKTASVLEADARFASVYAETLKIAQAKDRLPSPEFHAGEVYNFWQDTDHPHGLWRRTSLSSFALPEPRWTDVLDLDALSKSESANWVWNGANCERSSETRCLISLSDGGEDAVAIREFDLSKGVFVDNGFVLPKGKQTAAWVSPDALLVAREWLPGEVTASGYPFVVKSITRGQPLSAAREIFRGSASDQDGVLVKTLHDAQGGQAVLIARDLTIFDTEWWLVTPDGLRRLALPLKTGIRGLVAGQLLVILAEDWIVSGRTLPSGSLVSLSLSAVLADPSHLNATLVYAPGPRESIETVATTKSNLLVVGFQNVRGRAFVYSRRLGGGWNRRQLGLPDNDTISLQSADDRSDTAFLSTEGFLEPTALWRIDTATGRLDRVKVRPAKFNASGDVVEQFEAASADGTKVPYFVVHPKRMPLDGSNPALLWAYGGFQISETPFYAAITGKIWLERGGVFVLANVRGGGEFGPAWHDAVLKTRRQGIYDDFAAVAQDLIARGITSPRRLGIEGSSNGGLLMGVEFTQHPELWSAVDMGSPILDLLRVEKIAAGASWVGEYGSVANPDERAFLASTSPYNNLRADAAYPEPFIWTATNDDRVGPQHARKFAAKLSAMGKPYLFYEKPEGGHSSGANQQERARTSAMEFVYLMRKLMN
jgi:prolyl oligopeptidase